MRIGIITGASSGIGRSIALKFATIPEIKIILNGRNLSKLIELQKETNQIAGREISKIIVGDVYDKNTAINCIQMCKDSWNTAPCFFIACAGRGLPGTLLSSKEEEWQSLINTNVIGLLNQLKAITKSMIDSTPLLHDFVSYPRDIIVIGSSIGRNVSPFNSVYGSTKFATHGLTEALRRELGPKGIRVTLIEPGLVATNFQKNAGYDMEWFKNYSNEVGPVLGSDDIANIIKFSFQLPGNINMDNISVRPTRQSYP